MHKYLLAAAVAALTVPAVAQDRPAAVPIDTARLTETVRTLASDTFEGRAPGTRGEDRTIGYLIARLQGLGLEPGGKDGAWVQSVPLLHTRLGTPATLAAQTRAGPLPLAFKQDIYVSTVRDADRAAIAAAPLVFVGYGVSAPERKWDDFKGMDLKGKVAVFLVNDPDFEATKGDKVAGTFGGKRMTYYGRWTYKFEEAARRGAVGALIVHDTPGAGYGWNVVISPNGENYALAGEDTPLQLQGWLSGDAASRLFAGAGMDLAKLRVAARSAAFKAVAMNGATFTADVPVTRETVTSHNVLAKIPGTAAADEAVMFGAHWDAYGAGPADAQGRIYRAGANDDALGVAGLLEIARRFKAAPAPRRSVLFGFWTAEERGLLGSEFYARNPTFPLDKTVANLTLDILQTAGPARDTILVGEGQSSLEEDMAKAAAAQGRTVTPENLPERGLFYRADHFSFAKRGVPVLLQMGIAGASDLVTGGRPAGQAWIDAYTGKCYHQACDAWDPSWNLDGAAMDIDLLARVGAGLADGAAWPTWKAGSEFRTLRPNPGK
ncbi:M20/M25/M40 family metallo-hydrolase [Parablastomonas sp. CN1-191]|uniref:M20/M25/M40 family metallo-hydrolase n=1 Tax=Parablastomonas sp. CN1-191 TaxID=3400908 RepID=UPI003BF91A02